jgi:hypothetical protein
LAAGAGLLATAAALVAFTVAKLGGDGEPKGVYEGVTRSTQGQDNFKQFAISAELEIARQLGDKKVYEEKLGLTPLQATVLRAKLGEPAAREKVAKGMATPAGAEQTFKAGTISDQEIKVRHSKDKIEITVGAKSHSFDPGDLARAQLLPTQQERDAAAVRAASTPRPRPAPNP